MAKGISKKKNRSVSFRAFIKAGALSVSACAIFDGFSLSASAQEAGSIDSPSSATAPTLVTETDTQFVSALGRRPAGALSDKQRDIRLHHAHELLGRFYKRSSVTVGEDIPKINSAVYHWAKNHLPTKYKGQSGRIAQTVIDQSLKHEFDPVFLLSVIEGESSWRPEKVGRAGEIGLMQLRPTTARWMASKAGVKWRGKETLLDPCSNIKIGAAYLDYLRERFDDHARLYLAAYNMGQANVDSALLKNVWPKDYPIHIMKRYVGFYEFVGAKRTNKKKPSVSVTMESSLGSGSASTSELPTEARTKSHGRPDRS